MSIMTVTTKITRHWLERKTKSDLAQMYLDLLDDYEKLEKLVPAQPPVAAPAPQHFGHETNHACEHGVFTSENHCDKCDPWPVAAPAEGDEE